MQTGVIDPIGRTFDLGVYDETNSSLNVTSAQISFTFRDENNRLIKYTKAIDNPKHGELGDYLVSSPCLEVPEPFALNGYYPLYQTVGAASSASELNSYHEHTINEKVFYMPNQSTNVPNYHGTYTPANTYEELGGFLTITKQETKTKGCIGKLLTDTNNSTLFDTNTFYDSNGVQRTALLVPVAL